MDEHTAADRLINMEVQWRKAARRLTEAERSHDIERRRELAAEVHDIFEEWGYPDWHSRLTRLRDDTHHMKRMRETR